MPRKKVCPVGLICMDTQYLLVLLSLSILILLYFLFFKKNINNRNSDNRININNRNNDNIGCSKKINNGLINKYKKNDYERDIANKEMITNSNKNHNSNNITNDTNSKSERDIVINYKHVNTSDYLINKDYERIVNPLIPPERRNHHMNNNPYEIVRNGVPINIPTRGYSGGIVQVGALYKENINNDNTKIGNNSETIILPLFGMPVHNGSNKWIYYTTSDKYNQVKLPITNKNKVCNSDYGCDELYENDIVTVPAYNGNFKVVKYEYDKPKYLPHII